MEWKPLRGVYKGKTKFITVRFGNVLASNGSVVTLFERQIAKGGPVTVTHPDMKRYFMTVKEAVQLVLQASAMGKRGEIFILDMGEPIRIVDMARHLITLSGYEPEKDIPIQFIGKRPGEKLYEELWNGQEKRIPTANEKIFMVQSAPYDWGKLSRQLKELQEITLRIDRRGIIRKLKEMIPEYEPHWQEPQAEQKPEATES